MKEKFLIKLGHKLKIMPATFIDNLSANQAMMLGLACSNEQKQQLLKDAVEGDKYYYGRKVVDELEVSLDRLEKIYPSLRECIQNLSKTNRSSN